MSPPPIQDYPEVHIKTLGLDGDLDVRRLLRKALRDAWPASRKFGWKIGGLCELAAEDGDVGYTGEDGTLFVKVRNPGKRRFYSYSFVLATLLHELTHLSVLGHGKTFYRLLAQAASECGADPSVRKEVRAHICGELLNAVCDNDARRVKALLSVLPEAVSCPLPGQRQLPLEYAAHHGRVAITRLLIDAKADVMASADGLPPLLRAEARGNTKTARILLLASSPDNTPPANGCCSGKQRQCHEEEEEEKRQRNARKTLKPSLSLPLLADLARGPLQPPPVRTKPRRSAVTLSGSLAL